MQGQNCFAPLQGKIRRNYFYLPPAAGEMVGQCLNNFWLGRGIQLAKRPFSHREEEEMSIDDISTNGLREGCVFLMYWLTLRR